MKITARLISITISIIIPLLTLSAYCGVLKHQINTNEKQIIKLEAQVMLKDKELKSEIDKKVDIAVFNEAYKNLYNSIGVLRQDNLIDHEQLNNYLQKIDNKLDRLIEGK